MLSDQSLTTEYSQGLRMCISAHGFCRTTPRQNRSVRRTVFGSYLSPRLTFVLDSEALPGPHRGFELDLENSPFNSPRRLQLRNAGRHTIAMSMSILVCTPDTHCPTLAEPSPAGADEATEPEPLNTLTQVFSSFGTI